VNVSVIRGQKRNVEFVGKKLARFSSC